MFMEWFLPLSVVVGVACTRTALHFRHRTQDSGWWLLPVLSWFPLVCWFLAQFVTQG
jgi:hypothetical protein